ncbi:hypothetical protein L0337_13645 [candidate division KSB1 bacterium]|nr:hypothetical protein [candidate division KSB1 bacterium]
MKHGAILLLALEFISLLNANATAQLIYFDDASSELIKMGNVWSFFASSSVWGSTIIIEA